MTDFIPFPKMARLMRDVVITEKLDGTNAQIHITEDGKFLVGSRTRWIVPGNDNFAFAKWAYENEEELRRLGPGSHFGEWWGQGIQRGYGLEERKFSLFNVARWADPAVRPVCCSVVPVLYRGPFSTELVDRSIQHLSKFGSWAAPGFMDPEGVIVFHAAAGIGFKRTCKHDEKAKGQQ